MRESAGLVYVATIAVDEDGDVALLRIEASEGATDPLAASIALIDAARMIVAGLNEPAETVN